MCVLRVAVSGVPLQHCGVPVGQRGDQRAGQLHRQHRADLLVHVRAPLCPNSSQSWQRPATLQGRPLAPLCSVTTCNAINAIRQASRVVQASPPPPPPPPLYAQRHAALLCARLPQAPWGVRRVCACMQTQAHVQLEERDRGQGATQPAHPYSVR